MDPTTLALILERLTFPPGADMPSDAARADALKLLEAGQQGEPEAFSHPDSPAQYDADFEEQHPRDEGGEFVEKGGGGKGKKKSTPATREAAMVARHATSLGYDPAALTDEQAARLVKVVGRMEFAWYSPDKIKEIAARHEPEERPEPKPAFLTNPEGSVLKNRATGRPIEIEGEPLRVGDVVVIEEPDRPPVIAPVAHAWQDTAVSATGYSSGSLITIKPSMSMFDEFGRPPSEVSAGFVRRATQADLDRVRGLPAP